MLRLVITLLVLSWSSNLFAQPSNDKCSGAIEISIANNQQSCIWTSGTTVGTKDAVSVVGPTVCSTNFYRDDVWYKMTLPASTDKKAITVKLALGEAGDMTLAGMAIYPSISCLSSNTPYLCANFASGDPTELRVGLDCLPAGGEILIRVWSGDGPASNWQLGEGTFKICAYYTENKILWGANGEGSFNGGFNGWTTTSSSCNNFPLWFWSKDVFCTKGLYSTNGGTISSLSDCNGAACFDSDFYDTGGTANGTGPCIAPQSGTLESPTIDLSAYPNLAGVNLVFNQALRQYQSQYFVEYSIDNGNFWIPIQINTKEEDPVLYTVNGPFVNNVRRVYIPGVGGKSQVKVRFRYEASFYYWIIDDVFITEREPYNTKVNPFYAIAPNKIWQQDQLESFGGLADIANIGSKTSEHTNLKLEVFDANNAVIWTDNLQYGSVLSDTVIENKPMVGSFTHPNNNVTNYSAKYTISGDSLDIDLADNTRTFDWTVSESTMSKENTTTLSGGVQPTTDKNFTWGNIYHIVNNKNSVGNDLKCNYVDFGLSNPNQLMGATIFVYIYKWDNTNDDDVAQESERTIVGYNQLDIGQGELANTLYTLPVLDFTTFENGIFLEANTDYIIAVQYSTPADNPNLDCFISSSSTIDYSAATLKTTLPGFGPARFNHILDVGNTGVFNATTFSGGTTPVIRMHISSANVATHEALDPLNKITLAPNPVANDLNVNIELLKESKKLSLRVVDISGKLVLNRELNNVKSTKQAFDVSTLSNGSYLFKLTSDAGTRALKFIVSK